MLSIYSICVPTIINYNITQIKSITVKVVIISLLLETLKTHDCSKTKM